MWEVRFFGVDDKGFKFLQDLTSETFSKQEHDLKGNNFIEYFINIKSYDNEEATKILEIAEKELKIYVTLLKLNGYKSNLKVDHPCKINEDGTRMVYMFFEDKINITASIEVKVNGEIIYSSYDDKITNNKKLLNNSLENEIKKELFMLLGYEENWINAYKIYEILKHHYKNEKKLKKIDELSSFAHSANSPDAIGIGNARHAVQLQQSPKKIANLPASYKKLIELSLEFIKQNV